MKARSIAAIAGGSIALAVLIVLPLRKAMAVSSSGSQTASSTAATAESTALKTAPADFIAGFDTGLYRISADGSRAEALWQDGEVKKIIHVESPSGWYFLSSKGVFFSPDLSRFENRSGNLPVKTYKTIIDGKKNFVREVQDLKNLDVDRGSALRLCTCTKDAVYYSDDGGARWQNLGTPVSTTGLKTAALAPLPGSDTLAVWASHPIKGLFARRVDGKGGWIDKNAGLPLITGTTSVEEIADICRSADGRSVYASQSFIPRLYCLAPGASAFSEVYAAASDTGCIESLAELPGGELRFITQSGIERLKPGSAAAVQDAGAELHLKLALKALPEAQLSSLYWNEHGVDSSVSELWLASFRDRKPYRAAAENHQGLYLATGFMVHPESRDRYLKLMKDRHLNAVVLDMKDDTGRLRFSPQTPLLRTMGKTASPLDVEGFVKEAKAQGIYLIARIVVFKDQVIYDYAGGKYAVWDSSTKKPWQGAGTKEYWVDPYSEDVWAYNVAIANEIISRGFDEIQFDYIRFPTDGTNLGNASFRCRDPGMDKESALASFLGYARANIKAPLSIDIYGANGWYRSGVRTGQDVELLSKYVDAICPMYYPSHFEQTFLANPPAEQRPYRIYRLGTLRTNQIARGKIVVRPYVQAFYMNVSYDRVYYNLDYVKREVMGVRDSRDEGMTFWNNAGRYDDVPVLSLDEKGGLIDLASPIIPGQAPRASAGAP